MKVVFVGPSLPDAGHFAGPDIVIRPPAIQGDVLAAVRQGAVAIGLIDGGFEYTAPVWHKEILYALSRNVAVFGASSMGALRAAECVRFGMVGIGAIFRGYASGAMVDDADVALLHAPPELGSRPLTVPLVNVRATVRKLVDTGVLPSALADRLQEAAAGLFFKERTWRAVVERGAETSTEGPADLLATLIAATVDQKRIDALELMEALDRFSALRGTGDRDWTFEETSIWTVL